VDYSQSKQWRNGRFHNPPEWPLRHGFTGVLRWQLRGRTPAEPNFAPPQVDNDGQGLRDNRSEPSVTWIGHATLLLQAEGMSVLTDPMFSPRILAVRRLAPPGVSLAHLPPIDVVVVSHNHRDHLDEASVRALGPEVTFVVPLGLAAWFKKRGLHRVVELDWWQETEVAARTSRIRVTLVPAQHWSMRGPLDANRSLWGGYVIESPAVRFYFAGDTGYPAAFKDIGRRYPGIDYALLPIGAYAPRWFMQPQHIGPEEAATAFGELGARSLIPMHWGTFRLSDEPLGEPPVLLRKALGSDVDKLTQLAIGQTFWGLPRSRQTGTPLKLHDTP
jgi:N-acyl-phosphatidylethanolamine-hydrolysing phospholipase D